MNKSVNQKFFEHKLLKSLFMTSFKILKFHVRISNTSFLPKLRVCSIPDFLETFLDIFYRFSNLFSNLKKEQNHENSMSYEKGTGGCNEL